jgi:replicative DNA helicase
MTHYCDIIQAKSRLRQLIRVADDMANQSFAGDADPTTIIERVENVLAELREQVAPEDQAQHISHYLKAVTTRLTDAIDGKEDALGMVTPWPSLNAVVTPFAPGQITIVAGRPAHGKSVMALNLAMGMRYLGHPAAGIVFSLEMLGEEEALRSILAQCTRVNQNHLRNLAFMRANPWALTEMLTAVEGIWNQPVWFDERSTVTVADIDQTVRTIKRVRDLQWIVVDYMQLLATGAASRSRTEDLREIGYGLLGIAKRHNLHVIVCSQLNRGVDARMPPRPQQKDMMESGYIEAVAHRIIYTVCPAKYGRDACEEFEVPKDESMSHLHEIGVTKQRSGRSIGNTILALDGANYRFRELSLAETVALNACGGTIR